MLEFCLLWPVAALASEALKVVLPKPDQSLTERSARHLTTSRLCNSPAFARYAQDFGGCGASDRSAPGSGRTALTGEGSPSFDPMRDSRIC